MSLAICLQCGARKIGGFSPCHVCGYEPVTATDQARSLMLTDHNLSASELRAVAKQIKSGTPPTFDADILTALSAEIGEFDGMHVTETADEIYRKASLPGADWLWWLLTATVVGGLIWVVIR